MSEWVGRDREKRLFENCLQAKRNVLLEGPVGVGKTTLALVVARQLGKIIYRVDGDLRYTEQKLVGWFDPPSVMKQGFVSEAFYPGPLVEAMRNGGILFINEINRLPEGVQNILLPALDERKIIIPRLGEVIADTHFLVIATQNPQEYVATTSLSEALLDRFELIVLDYPEAKQECAIVLEGINQKSRWSLPWLELFTWISVALMRKTRQLDTIKRGASLRAGMSMAWMLSCLHDQHKPLYEAVYDAALLVLPTRIELVTGLDQESSVVGFLKQQLPRWIEEVLSKVPGEFADIVHDLLPPQEQKKNS